MTETYDIVPAHLAIKAMRSSGFKSTDHAVAELIDNSIQAGIAHGNETTNVEVICLEQAVHGGARTTNRINEILVYDNASGMDAQMLRKALMFGQGTNLDPDSQTGIGKFGMGLPNASISQCKLVQVYSWRDGKCHRTLLDIDKILRGELREVPEAHEVELPEKYRRLIKSEISDHGTLVVWQRLDRTTWVRHKAFFRNSEFLIGRVYRRFISNGSAKIRFAAYNLSESDEVDFLDELYVRPNDPLMITPNTSAPGEFAKVPAFEEFGKPDHVNVTLTNGKTSVVVIRYSMATNRTRGGDENRDAGGDPIGKYCARNVGVSVVRAGRELEMNQTWVRVGDTRERWWGVEIEFQPELDDIFGVTNDKQAATNLFRASVIEDAENLGLKPSELLEQLHETNDPKVINYEISQSIATRMKTIRDHIQKQKVGSREVAVKKRQAEQMATVTTEMRSAEKPTKSDEQFKSASEAERIEALKNAYEDAGYDPAHTEALSVSAVQTGLRFVFAEAPLASPAIFDWEQRRGEYFIKLNTKHPAYKNLIELVRSSDDDEDSPALVGLKLLITAWARMEDEEENERKLEALQDVRMAWGQIAREYLRGE